MINFETNDSLFFVANKNYCEKIETNLNALNLNCSGFCNSYGYEIETTFVKQNITYNLQFYKYQTTQNAIVIPMDANESCGTTLIINGLNKKFKVCVGKSTVKRLFISKYLKSKIAKPYFITFNHLPQQNFLDNLFKVINDYKIVKYKLNKGTLVCNINIAISNPMELISSIEKTMVNWR
jgi:hypothetical protein